jgi:hypothetical protein
MLSEQRGEIFRASFSHATPPDAKKLGDGSKPQRKTIYRVDPLAFFFVFCFSALREARLDLIHTIQHYL